MATIKNNNIYKSNTNTNGYWWTAERAKRILRDKYLKENEKDFLDLVDRVAGEFNPIQRVQLKTAMAKGDFILAGSMLKGIGEKERKISVSNCYISKPPLDTIPEIFDCAKEMAITFSRRGGCGVCLDNIRPRDSKVYNSAIQATGPVSFIELYNTTAKIIGAEGRRAALLVGLICSHPDIEEFINLKTKKDCTVMANLSVFFTDKFMEAVKSKSSFDLYFKVQDTGEEIIKTIDAYTLYMKFCQAQHDWAEPGALFIDRMKSHNILSGYPKEEYDVVCCNPCSEYHGDKYNACALGSINLYNCIVNPFTEEAAFDFDYFEYLIKLGVRIIDESLDIGYNAQPLQAHRDAIDNWRAIGLGTMGMSDMFVALGIRYGSDESIKLVNEIYKFMFHTAVKESSVLASEKGSFGKYNYNKLMKSKMMKDLPKEIKDTIKQNGLRNGSLLSIAPTGTISMLLNVSSGIEPYFGIKYVRTTHTNQNEKTGETISIFVKAVSHLIENNNMSEDEVMSLPYVVDTYQIDSLERIKLQSAAQEYVDNAISSTVNLRKSATVEEIHDIYLKAWESGCKGVTVFRDGCKRDPIIGVKNTEDERPDIPVELDTVVPIPSFVQGTLSAYRFTKSTACVKKMYIMVTELYGKPFDVFVSTSQGCQSNINTVARQASLLLRSGVKVDKVIEELSGHPCSACLKLRENGEQQLSRSCGSAIASALQEAYDTFKQKGINTVPVNNIVAHYDPEEPEFNELEKCPNCGENTMIPSKCSVCSNCGYSVCS